MKYKMRNFLFLMNLRRAELKWESYSEGKIAAIIIEPIAGNMGVIKADDFIFLYACKYKFFELATGPSTMCEYYIIVFSSLSEISSSMYVFTTFFDLATKQSPPTLVIPDSASFQREREREPRCALPRQPHDAAQSCRKNLTETISSYLTKLWPNTPILLDKMNISKQ